MRKHALLLLACTALLSASTGTFAQSIFERAAKDETTQMSDENPAMAAAFRKARATLDGFLKLLDAPPRGTHGYAVKLRVSEGLKVEYFWIINLKREDEHFSGVLDNIPRLVKNVQEGQSMRFGRSDILDWLYIDAARRRMMGNFTLCALLTQETLEEATKLKRHIGLVCD